MIDDIFSVDVSLKTVEREASFKLYYQQVTADDGYEFQTHALADAWVANLNVPLRGMLASDCHFQGVRVRQVHSDAGNVHDPQHTRTGSTGSNTTVGLAASPSLPANLPAIMGIVQESFGARSNGRVFISGIPEAETVGNTLSSDYRSTEFHDFAIHVLGDDLNPIAASPDTTRFKLGVISQKIAYAPIQAWIDGGMVGPKPGRDYGGAFALATGVLKKPLISAKKLRATRAFGGATLLGT